MGSLSKPCVDTDFDLSAEVRHLQKEKKDEEITVPTSVLSGERPEDPLNVNTISPVPTNSTPKPAFVILIHF